MRREGYEFSVSPPRVVYGKDENGKRTEPIEEVQLDILNDLLATCHDHSRPQTDTCHLHDLHRCSWIS